tara:strand:- start:1378 stop:1536 length:159 start_codon:yes stop_codon:yes gene_type:complete
MLIKGKKLNWELFGDLVLVALIIMTPVIFAVANANYLPEMEEEKQDDAKERS